MHVHYFVGNKCGHWNDNMANTKKLDHNFIWSENIQSNRMCSTHTRRHKNTLTWEYTCVKFFFLQRYRWMNRAIEPIAVLLLIQKSKSICWQIHLMIILWKIKINIFIQIQLLWINNNWSKLFLKSYYLMLFKTWNWSQYVCMKFR